MYIFTVHVSLSEKLPTHQSETFTVSLILSVPINIFVNIFLNFNLGTEFSVGLLAS